MAKNTVGTVTQVMGAVVDVRFEGELPIRGVDHAGLHRPVHRVRGGSILIGPSRTVVVDGLAVLFEYAGAAVAAHDVHQAACARHADTVDREVCVEVTGVFGVAGARFVDLDRCVIGARPRPGGSRRFSDECAGHDAAPGDHSRRPGGAAAKAVRLVGAEVGDVAVAGKDRA